MNSWHSLIDASARETAHVAAPPPHHMHLTVPNRAQLATAVEAWQQAQATPIPRRIHQIWIGPRRPPWRWINTFREAFIQAHPAWEYKLWREPEIAELSLVNRELYQQEPTLYGKADILRYELLEQFGGIYVDADMRWLHKPLDELRHLARERGIFAAWENQWDLANSVLGCAPRHPLMRLVVRTLAATYRRLRIERGWAPWVATGPRFFSEVVRELPIERFPTTFFYPTSWHGLAPDTDVSAFAGSYMVQYGYSTNHLAAQHDQFT